MPHNPDDGIGCDSYIKEDNLSVCDECALEYQ